MKIYTKKGDQGETGLFGGLRLPKHHIRIESYGSVDELNSYLGLIRDHQQDELLRKELKGIQEALFSIGSLLASDPTKDMNLPKLPAEKVTDLEKAIDRMEQGLPPLRNFILPGGHPSVSYCHIARCVCRRAERNMVALHEAENLDQVLLQYINRLSDYLFVLARHTGRQLGVEDVTWNG